MSTAFIFSDDEEPGVTDLPQVGTYVWRPYYYRNLMVRYEVRPIPEARLALDVRDIRRSRHGYILCLCHVSPIFDLPGADWVIQSFDTGGICVWIARDDWWPLEDRAARNIGLLCLKITRSLPDSVEAEPIYVRYPDEVLVRMWDDKRISLPRMVDGVEVGRWEVEFK